jgi:hypothetical protein
LEHPVLQSIGGGDMKRSDRRGRARPAVTGEQGLRFLGEMAGSLAPGAGLADASGMYYSPMQGEQVPGLLENLGEGRYGTAVMQGLGLLGDATYAGGPILGATIGTALKAPGAVGKGIKTAQAAPTSQPVQEGIRAYQGSPHDFAAERLVRYPDGRTEYIVGAPDVLPDIPAGAEVLRDFPMGRMRMDKIGTGEGAQAYGPGLYAAEAEAVGRRYRDELTNRVGVSYEMADGTIYRPTSADPPIALNDILDGQPMSNWTNWTQKELEIPEIRELVDVLNRHGAPVRRIEENPGRMYEINIRAKPEDMLNWDLPLAKQPEQIKQSLRNILDKEYGKGFFDSYAKNNNDVRDLFNNFDDIISREVLAREGIPGVRYLDEISRHSGHGTHNYAIFDDSLIDILRKYGIVGLLGGGLLTGGVLSQQEAQTVPGS